MSENQVTIEGETHPLPRPFMVIATQNPLEHHGAYPLPDSQLDRFLMSIPVGYPGRESEREMLTRPNGLRRPESLAPVMDDSEVLAWQERAEAVRLEPEVVEYILEIVARTRGHERLRLGASPRGALALRQAARAHALVEGRDYCLPDDVKAVARAVLSHRLIVNGPGGPREQRRAAVEVVEDVLEAVPVPV
jgi:MoxR-like ATPase